MEMWGEAPTPWMRDMARDILNLLDVAYPGHPWKVQVYGDNSGGGFHIRHLEFEGRPYGINEPRAHLFASASEFRKRVLAMGGELLERVYLSRAARIETQQITRMDGIPDAHQPAQYQRDQEVKKLEAELREEPMPQVARGIANG